MKTLLYSFDLLETHFYIVKLGFTGVYIIFLVLHRNMDCGCLLGPFRLAEAVLMSTLGLCFWHEYEKYQNFLSESFPFLVKNFNIFE